VVKLRSRPRSTCNLMRIGAARHAKQVQVCDPLRARGPPIKIEIVRLKGRTPAALSGFPEVVRRIGMDPVHQCDGGVRCPRNRDKIEWIRPVGPKSSGLSEVPMGRVLFCGWCRIRIPCGSVAYSAKKPQENPASGEVVQPDAFPQHDRGAGSGRKSNPRHRRQLCNPQAPEDTPMAGPPSPLDVPLHPDLRILAQCSRKLLRQAHPPSPQARCVPIRRQVAINCFVAETNADPKPFVWTADPKRVLAAVKRGKQALESLH
jgi:hypothetical protein